MKAGIHGLATVTDSSDLRNHIKSSALRRMDGFSKKVLLSIIQAGESTEDAESTGLVLVTRYGPTGSSLRYLKDIILDGDEWASPTWFSSSIHNAPAGQLSIQKTIRGPVRTLAAGKDSIALGLITAVQWLENGTADSVYVAIGEEDSPLLPLMTGESPDSLEAGTFTCLYLSKKEKPGYGVIKTDFSGISGQENAVTGGSLYHFLTENSQKHKIVNITKNLKIVCFYKDRE